MECKHRLTRVINGVERCLVCWEPIVHEAHEAPDAPETPAEVPSEPAEAPVVDQAGKPTAEDKTATEAPAKAKKPKQRKTSR